MTEQAKRALIDRYLDAYNDFDVDGMMATVHPAVEFEDVSGGEVNASASAPSPASRPSSRCGSEVPRRCYPVTPLVPAQPGRPPASFRRNAAT